MSKGWIALHRKFKSWEWYDDILASRLFLHCLLSANHKEKKWKGVTIPRGSFVSGRKALSVETGLSEQQIRTNLKKLESTSEITIKSTNKNSLITIVKYEEYQGRDEGLTSKETTKSTNKEPTNNQRITTTNNVNNENNVNNKDKGEKTKRFSPPTLGEVKAYCDERGNNINPNTFINYYATRDWKLKSGKMKCWKACVRTWEHNSINKTPAQQSFKNKDYGQPRGAI